MFGLKFDSIWRKPAPPTEAARASQEKMLVAEGQREFFLGPASATMAFIEAGGDTMRLE